MFVKHERVLMNLQMLMFAVTAWLKKTVVLRSSFTIIQIQKVCLQVCVNKTKY